MRGNFTSLPLKRIALFGFLLNMFWEFLQCTVFYDMRGWKFWETAVWTWSAIFGDVLIVLGVVAIADFLVGAPGLGLLDPRGWITLLGVGLVAGITLEWLAQVLRLWTYTAWMPGVRLLGYDVGLLPVMQVTLLPALSVSLGRRRTDQRPAGR